MTVQASLESRAHAGTLRQRKGQVTRLALVALAVTPFAFAMLAEFPLCPSAGLLGLPCPGCGLTRASLLLLSGDLAAAFTLHPLVLPLAPLYFGAIGYVMLDYVRGPSAGRSEPSPSQASVNRRRQQYLVTAFWLILLVATLGLWLARFAGYFGGPAPVQSYGTWASQHEIHKQIGGTP